LRRVDRRIFKLKETNALKIVNNLAKNFCTSKDLFNVVVKDEKDFRKANENKIDNVAKDFKISKGFRKAIYLNKEFNAKKNCFEDTTVVNFYLASIRATTLKFLIIVEF